MRISDWSSDVCSSDLLPSERPPQVDAIGPGRRDGRCIEERSHGEATEGIALVGQVSGPQCERPAHIALIACPEVEKHMTFLLEEFGVQIGRASCRERVCQDVKIWVVAVSLKKT